MTVKTPRSRNNYIGTDLLSDYDYQFRIEAEVWLVVKKRTISTGVIVTLPNNAINGFIVLSGVGDTAGGKIQLRASSAPVNLTSDEELAIRRVVPIIQGSNIRDQGDSFPSRLEDAHDFRTYVDQQHEDTLLRTITLNEAIDPDTVDMELPAPVALAFIRWNATANGWENASSADLGAIILPGTPGIAVFLGSDTFASRELDTTGDIDVSNPDGVAGNPNIDSTVIDGKIAANTDNITANANTIGNLDAFSGSEQSVPDDTVFVTAGQVNDVFDLTAKPVDVAANAASGITFPSTTASNSRIDLLVQDLVTGVFSRVAGVDAPSPTVPAYPKDKRVRCEVSINETGAVIINNADIRNVRTYLDYSKIKGLQEARGSLNSDNTNNKTIVTGIPIGAELLHAELGQLANNITTIWHAGSSNHLQTGSTSAGRFANATDRFTISGNNLVIGSNGVNNGSSNPITWQVLFREVS